MSSLYFSSWAVGWQERRMTGFLLAENTCKKGTRSAIHFLPTCKFVLELLG
jgi:hypothetical protein